MALPINRATPAKPHHAPNFLCITFSPFREQHVDTGGKRTRLQALFDAVLTVLEIRKQVKKKSPVPRTGQPGEARSLFELRR
jgi:hypothetical protein